MRYGHVWRVAEEPATGLYVPRNSDVSISCRDANYERNLTIPQTKFDLRFRLKYIGNSGLDPRSNLELKKNLNE